LSANRTLNKIMITKKLTRLDNGTKAVLSKKYTQTK